MNLIPLPAKPSTLQRAPRWAVWRTLELIITHGARVFAAGPLGHCPVTTLRPPEGDLTEGSLGLLEWAPWNRSKNGFETS
jgi:hypothetical protein